MNWFDPIEHLHESYKKEMKNPSKEILEWTSVMAHGKAVNFESSGPGLKFWTFYGVAVV